MSYRNRRYSKPSRRVIVVKYAGKCACCGAEIKAGETADYYPAGTIAGVSEGRIAHIGGLDGNSARCTAEIRKREYPEYAAELGRRAVNGSIRMASASRTSSPARST